VEEIMSGLPFWIVGGIIAIVMSILVNRSKQKLGEEKSQELERSISENLQKRFSVKKIIMWMVGFPLAGGIIVFIILWLLVATRG